MITNCNKSIPCCGPPAAAPFFPSLSISLPSSYAQNLQLGVTPLSSILPATKPSFPSPTVGPRLCCPSLNLCHRFLSFANQNAELHLTKSIHQTLKFENQKKALADSTMALAVSATKFFY
ncbi:hypothetical protein AMTRI_Chr08g206680 [Amborella trichopoda]